MAGDLKHQSRTKRLTQIRYESADEHLIGSKKAMDLIIKSEPPLGFYRVVNLYCEKKGATYKLVVIHEDVPQS